MSPHLALQVAAKGPRTVEVVGTAAAMPVQRSHVTLPFSKFPFLVSAIRDTTYPWYAGIRCISQDRISSKTEMDRRSSRSAHHYNTLPDMTKEILGHLPLVLQGFCNLSINSGSINVKGSGFIEELNKTCHLLEEMRSVSKYKTPGKHGNGKHCQNIYI